MASPVLYFLLASHVGMSLHHESVRKVSKHGYHLQKRSCCVFGLYFNGVKKEEQYKKSLSGKYKKCCPLMFETY